MNLELLRALNGFVAHRDAVEDPVELYMAVSQVLFAGLVLAVFAFGAAAARAGPSRRSRPPASRSQSASSWRTS